jgi:LysM repeat protein
MKIKILLLLILACLLFPVSPAQAQEDPASQVILLVNQLRASYGLPPYEVDPILAGVAQAQVEWIAANDSPGHLGPGGTTPDQRAKLAGYGAGYDAFVIENVASGTLELNTPELVVTMWQGDEGHLGAMISSEYEHIGVGYTEAFGMSWYVMMVGWVADEDNEEAEAESEVEDEPVQATAISAVLNPPFLISTPDATGALYHEVQAGQAAWTIAVVYQVDLAELLALNNLTEESFIQPGDLLLVRPAPTAAPTATQPPVPQPSTPTGAPAGAEKPSPSPSPTATARSQARETVVPTLPEGKDPGPTPLKLLLGIGASLVVMAALIIRLRPKP